MATFFDYIKGQDAESFYITKFYFKNTTTPTIVVNNTDFGKIVTEIGAYTFTNKITFNDGLTIPAGKTLVNNGTIVGGTISAPTITTPSITNPTITGGASIANGGIKLEVKSDKVSITGTTEVAGDIKTTGNGNIWAKTFYARSDKRLKDNIKDCNYGLDIIQKIAVKEYNFKGEEETAIGCIAQELNEILPEELKDSIVAKGEYLAINDSKLIYFLINAVKELKQEIETLKNK